MKYFLYLLFIGVLFLGCKSSTVVMNADDPSQNVIPKASKNDVIINSAPDSKKALTITSLELKETVEFLASNDLKGRNTGTDGINQAAVYIENKFKQEHLLPYFETYRDFFKVGDINAYNIVGFLEGQDDKLKDEVIIIGAHYDHIGYGKVIENDSIANGANDNAAGTSAVLALSKYFSTTKSNGRSLMFVLFSAEEMGLLGSKHLAGKLKARDIDLYSMFNIEMIGVPMKDKAYIGYLTGHKLSNMSDKLNEYVGDSNFIGFYEMSETYQLFKRSDNYPFYQEFKVPSQTLSTSDDYIYYHQVDDEVDKLNFEHMANTVNILIIGIEKMSNTPTKEIVLYDE
jgi:Zn-dependent M28 family amino/carboxypeptidase